MPVTFAKELVEIKEYVIDLKEKQDKKDAYKKIFNFYNEKVIIRGILYKSLPTEEEYVKSKQQIKRKIKVIQGYIGRKSTKMIELYKDIEKDRKIEYSIYENEYGMVNINIVLKGFIGQKYFKKYIKSGTLFDDMFKAEYQSKVFIIETVRKVFEENDIM